MKKTLILFVIITTTMLSLFTSCTKGDEKFKYPMETLYGTWSGTEVYLASSSEWVDITRYPYNELQFSIKFNPDGTYYGSGFFGNGRGTYKASGNTISTYISGELYAKYVIKSMSNNKAELTMYMEGDHLDMRVKKQ